MLSNKFVLQSIFVGQQVGVATPLRAVIIRFKVAAFVVVEAVCPAAGVDAKFNAPSVLV